MAAAGRLGAIVAQFTNAHLAERGTYVVLTVTAGAMLFGAVVAHHTPTHKVAKGI